MRKLDIKFTTGSSWIGSHYNLIVNNTRYDLIPGQWKYESKFGDVTDHAIYILKTEFGVVKSRDEINFEWDGTL